MRIGIADTCFARVNMGQVAKDTVKNYLKEQVAQNQVADQPTTASNESNEPKEAIEIERYTVPGFKDLPAACKILFEKYNCDIIVALGWVGDKEIDELCAHEANLGLIQCELICSKHILKVFFHVKEAENDEERQKEICTDRVQKHTINAIKLTESKTALTNSAGQGKRQGYNDAGKI